MLLRHCLTCAVLTTGLLIASAAIAQVNPNNQQNSPVTQAAKTLADAKTSLKKAQADVQKVRDKVKVQLLAKPEWAPVTSELTKAENDLTNGKRNAMNAAHAKPEYQQWVKQRDDADKVRQAASVTPAAGSDDTNKVSDAELATANNNYTSAVLKMKAIEKQTLADDQNIADATARVEAAKAKMAQLDAEIDESLKNDQQYMSLQQAVATAQQAVDQADVQLKQARQQLADQRANESRSRSQSSSSSYGSGSSRR